MATKCQVDEAAYRLTRAIRWAHASLPWNGGDPTLGTPSREYERLKLAAGKPFADALLSSLGFTRCLHNAHEVWYKDVTRTEVEQLRDGGFAVNVENFRDVVGVTTGVPHD
jgi:hypothetical protein